MLIGAPGALVKEINIVVLHWNLCNQCKSVVFNLKLALFDFLNQCLRGTRHWLA